MLRFFLKYWDKLSLLEILEDSLWSIVKMMEKFYDTGKCGFFFSNFETSKREIRRVFYR